MYRHSLPPIGPRDRCIIYESKLNESVKEKLEHRFGPEKPQLS